MHQKQQRSSDIQAVYRYLFGTIYPTSLTNKQQKKVNRILKKTECGIPIYRIFNCQNFYGQDFYINRHVLAPRPETELLAEQAILAKPQSVLDLCTGSGCIAATVAKHTKAKVDACDISRKAIKVAKRNGVNAFRSDLFSKVTDKYDVIVSNPPYVKSDDIGSLKKYEPKIAFDGGQDGLHFYRKIAEQSLQHLNQGGKVMLEVGYNQSQDVKKIFSKNFKDIEILKDYNQIERIIICKKN